MGNVSSGAPASKPRVLYVDAAEDVREVFAAVFGEDFECICVPEARTAFETLTARQDIDVVVSDAPSDAFDAFPDVQRIMLVDHDAPAHTTLSISGRGSAEGGTRDVKGRLFAYLTKPWDRAQLALAIERATKIRRLEQENRRLTGELRSSVGRIRIEEPTRAPARLLASSVPMQKVVAQLLPDLGANQVCHLFKTDVHIVRADYTVRAINFDRASAIAPLLD